MNERIKKLFDQAMEPNGIEGLGGSYYDLNPEKFAELVVKEIDNLSFRGTGYVTSDGEDAIKALIRDHFGIK